MKIPWFHRKSSGESNGVELAEARREVEDLGKRSAKLLKDNHFIVDVKKLLRPQ